MDFLKELIFVCLLTLHGIFIYNMKITFLSTISTIKNERLENKLEENLISYRRAYPELGGYSKILYKQLAIHKTQLDRKPMRHKIYQFGFPCQIRCCFQTQPKLF